MNYSTIPEHCRPSVQRYIETGQPVGDFLRSVFSNNLVDAVAHADPTNLASLRVYTLFLYNEAPRYPIASWGSVEIYKEWVALGGLRGIQAGEDAIRRAQDNFITSLKDER